MPTVTKIKNKSGTAWKVQIRIKGCKPESARFKTKTEAQAWGINRELELRNSADLVGGMTLGDAFKRFSEELPKDRKGRQWDKIRLKKFQSDPIALVPAADLKLEDGEDFIKRGLASGLAHNSVIREMNLIKPVVKQMVRWRWIDAYPWDQMKMPSAGKRRTKLYTQDEIEAILKHSGLVDGEAVTTTSQQVGIAFLVATETGMRLGEIINLRDEWWNRGTRVISLPDSATKTSTARDVPLSLIASDALSRLAVRPSGKLFSITSETASTLFRRIRKKANITDATFHDSRHYAVSKLSKKLEVLELARVIGHADINELLTYYEVDAADLAGRL